VAVSVQIAVDLTRGECIVAGLVGTWRNVRGLFDDYARPTPELRASEEWAWDIEAAGAEMAVAKWSNRYWNGMRRLDKADGDVNGWEVRCAAEAIRGRLSRLIVRQNDAVDRVVIFVTGQMPGYRLHGWILAADARREEWWETPRPPGGWFVPREALQPMDALPG
jgi:hypothetical protein